MLGVRANVISEVVARRALVAPDGVVADGFRDILFRTLLGVSEIPPITVGRLGSFDVVSIDTGPEAPALTTMTSRCSIL